MLLNLYRDLNFAANHTEYVIFMVYHLTFKIYSKDDLPGFLT